MDPEKVLVVDDEVANLQKLRRTLIHRYPVLAATRGREALEIVRGDLSIAVIIADQRMPDMTGTEFLRETLEFLPHAVRIILTGFTDVDVLMEAINTCKVFRYIVKPWDPPDLLMTVERGLEVYKLSVENERFRRELIRRERFARELEIAREIQRYILPPECPAIRGYEIAVEYHPAYEVGGDLYDFDWDPATGTLQVVVGDVSGKSIPAALYGAVFSGHLRTLLAHPLPPAEALSFLNSSLMERYRVSNYVAVTDLRFDLGDGSGLLANGGMPYPILVRDQQVRRLQVPGIPLGLIDGTSYEQVPVKMEKGDTLLLTSDGITDATNGSGEMYEQARLLESIRRHCALETAALANRLYQDVVDFKGSAELRDDITILAIRRLR
ncbi:MAG: SpoIIE family protein phosphatase [Acidobacteria bacterium]|nr:SpoIIE family protein phosphatase [Acidobacteriota bacterium]